MGTLRHRCRSAKRQDKAAAGGREAGSLVGHRETRGVHRRKCRQVFNSKQRDPSRQLIGSGEDLKVCADRAGKRSTVKVIERRGMVLPCVRTGSGRFTKVSFFVAPEWDAGAAECHR